jgi:hypothetical protein
MFPRRKVVGTLSAVGVSFCVGWQNEQLVVGAFCRGVRPNALTERPHSWTPLQYSPKNQFASTDGSREADLQV